MKVLFFLIIILGLGVKGIAQTFRIPVGVDSVIHSEKNYIRTTSNSCSMHFYDSCVFAFAGYYEKGQNTKLAQTPFSNDSYLPPKLHFLSKSAGTFIDSFEVHWRLIPPDDCNTCSIHASEAQYSFYITVIAFDTVLDVAEEDHIITKDNLDVFPNPVSNTLHIVSNLFQSKFIHLHIFDELGKDIMTVYDGILPEGKRDFSFKLPQGMYYVRMEMAEGVVTKKVVVD